MSGYTTFGNMLRWLEKPAGLTLNINRRELVALANKVRKHFYLLYEEVQLFMDFEQCVCIQTFYQDCRSCQNHYLGITLPAGVQQIEGLIVSGTPVSLQNHWRGYQSGIVERKCRTETFDMGDGYCTERDFGGCPFPIKFMCKDSMDCGKRVRVSYYDINGTECSEEIVLSLEYKATEGAAIGFKRPGGVVLPSDLKGGVVVALGNDASTILSEYLPWENIPNYHRIRINGVCDKDAVLIRGSRRYHDLFFDTDIVETDNELAIEQAALGFKFRDSTSAEPTLLAKAGAHMATARKYLMGEKARDEGGGVVRRFELGPRTIHRSGLTRRCR